MTNNLVITDGHVYRENMQRPKRYYVYIMSSKGGLYVGVTGFLMSRVLQHKAGSSGFTSRYHIDRLVYYEVFKYVNKPRPGNRNQKVAAGEESGAD